MDRIKDSGSFGPGSSPGGVTSNLFVELEGVEPSSKQGTIMLSTYLFCCWFSSCARKQTS